MTRSFCAAMLVTIACATAPSMNHLGGRAPDFTLQDSDGNRVHLKTLLAGGPVMLVFFPKAFTFG